MSTSEISMSQSGASIENNITDTSFESLGAEQRQGDESPALSSSSESSHHEGGVKKCRFNDCDNPAVEGTSKCAFHKNRRQCCVENCTNQVYARKLCVRHGGKKQCQAEGCDAHARGGGFCLQHGGFVVKRFCIVEGCSKQAHARQKCVRHGGGRRCKVDGCEQHARAGGLCNRHSHGHQCKVEGCNKTAQHSGSICFRHAMEMRAHGQEVPELNISKGGRAPKRRHDSQNQNGNLHQSGYVKVEMGQPNKNPQHAFSAASQAPGTDASTSSNSSNPFGLPLKITVPTNLPKISSGRTPLGGFPTPRTHEFSLLMGLPSPQIDQSQLPSVLAMASAAARQQSESANQNQSYYGNMSTIARPTQRSEAEQNMFSYGMTAPAPKAGQAMSSMGEEDIEAILNGYHGNKFGSSGASASPIAFQPQLPQYTVPQIPDTFGMTIFDGIMAHPMPMNTNMNGAVRSNAMGPQLPVAANQHQQASHYVARPKPGYMSSSVAAFEAFTISASPDANVPDYTSQFFVENQDQALLFAASTQAPKPEFPKESTREPTPLEVSVTSDSSSALPKTATSTPMLVNDEHQLQPAPISTGVSA